MTTGQHRPYRNRRLTITSQQRRSAQHRQAWPRLEPLEARILFAGDFPITRIIGPAEPLPGGLTINPNREAAISDSGKVLVTGQLSGAGVVSDNDLAMVLYDGADLSVVLREGDAIPGTGGRTYTFGDFPFRPAFTGDDVVGFSLLVDSTQPSARGVWSSTPGSGGSNIALRSPFDLNTSVSSSQYTGVSATGNVAYYVSGNPSRLFRNDVEILAGNGPVSFGGEDYLLLSISDAVQGINASDQFALDVRLRPAAFFSIIDSVVVIGPGGVVRGVTDETLETGIPNVFANNVHSIDINDAGQVLIEATLQGDVTATTDQALYLWDGDAFTLVVREGDILPGTTQPLAFTDLLPQFALSGSGQVLAQVNHDYASTVPAIAIWSAGQWQIVAAQGDPAPGTAAGNTFGDLGGAAINDSGTVVFGGSVRNSGGQQVATGIWAMVNGQLSNVVLTGDPVPGGLPGIIDSLPETRGLSKQTLGTGENGRRTVLTDDNLLVFATGNSGSPVGDGAFIANLSGPAQPGGVRGTVWSDAGGDGVLGGGEIGVPGVTVTLETPAGATVAGPVLTDSAGMYLFSGIEPGDYRVRVALPDNASFSPTGIDAEIGGPAGLSATFTLAEGEDVQLDAGLILPGPSATLTFPEVDIPFGLLVDLVQNPQPSLTFKVRFNDTDRVDEISLLDTRLSIVKFGTLEVLGTAVPDPQPGELDLANQTQEQITYRLDPPAEGWTAQVIGDYLVRVSVPAKDELGNDGAVDELAGLFSIVDNQPPKITPVLVTPEKIGEGFPVNHIAVIIGYEDHVALDDASLLLGNLAYRPKFTTQEVPFEFVGHDQGADRLSYRVLPPAGGFNEMHDGEYEVVTSSPTIKDDFGNAVAPGQVIGEFRIDFTPPDIMLTSTDSPVEGQASFTFLVGWSDNGSGLKEETFDFAQFRIRRPDGQLLEETLTRNERFSFTLDAPGDVWDETDRGVYTVELANQEARDNFDNATPQGTVVGTFSFLVQDTQSVTNEGNSKVTVRKDSGGLAKFLLKGAQFALETTVETELEKIVGKNELIINGAKDIVRLVIDPDNPEASLQIAIDLKNDIDTLRDQIPVGEIEALGHMKEVVAPGIEIVTDVVFPGLDRLTLGDVRDDHTITIGAPDDIGKPYVDITLDRVANTDIISDTPIGTLTVTEWIDDDGDPDTITAPWIGKIIVKGNKKEGLVGDFMADLNLSGVGAPKGVTLGSASIAGDLVGAQWNITGNVGAVAVKGDALVWDMTVDGTFKSVSMRDAADVHLVYDGDGGSVKFARWIGGSIFGGSVASLTGSGDAKNGVSGDLDIIATLFGHGDAKKPTLGPVKLAGDIRGGAWDITGHAAAISVNETRDTWTAGFTGDVASITTKADLSGTITANAIKSISVKVDTAGLAINVLQPVDAGNAKVQALGKMTVAGTMFSTTIRAAGHIGSITTGAMSNSRVLLGVEESVTGLPDAAGDFVAFPTLASFTVRGLPKVMEFSYINSVVAAWALGKVTVNFPQTNNGGVPFGFAADSVAGVAYKDTFGPFKAANLGQPGDFLSTGDFLVRVV